MIKTPKYNFNPSKKRRFRVVTVLFKILKTIIIILFVGFLIVAPLDILTHAIRKEQFLKFFITIGGIVVLILLNLYWFLYRFFTVKQLLKYIPKNYIPIFTATPTNGSLNNEKGKKNNNNKRLLISGKLYNITWDTFDLIPHLQYYYNYSQTSIVFNKGVSPPKKSFDNFENYNNYNKSDQKGYQQKRNLDDLIPFLINYDSIVQAFSQDLKFSKLNQNFEDFSTLEMNFLENNGGTFSDYMKKIFLDCQKYNIDTNEFDFAKFSRFYYKLQYSGRTPNLKSIKEKEFITFMQQTIHFYKIQQEIEQKLDGETYNNGENSDNYDYYSSSQSGSDGNIRHSGLENSKVSSRRTTSKGERPVFTFDSSEDDDDDDDDEEEVVEAGDDAYMPSPSLKKDIKEYSIKNRFLKDHPSGDNNSKPSLNSKLSDIKVTSIKKRPPSPKP